MSRKTEGFRLKSGLVHPCCAALMLTVLHFTIGLVPVVACVAASPKNGSVVVTLDVFSGRPNPSWSLTASDTKEFLRRVKSLPAATDRAAGAGNLGYRATQVEVRTATDGVILFSLSHGIVSVHRNGVQTQGADVGRQIELWLVNTGNGHVDPDLLKHVVGEISSSPSEAYPR
jgi:hypothetical protein